MSRGIKDSFRYAGMAVPLIFAACLSFAIFLLVVMACIALTVELFRHIFGA